MIFELAVILLASKLAGDLAARWGQPSVLGKLIIGLILGPSVLGVINNTEVLSEISQIGVILLMFIAGLETDMKDLKKSGKISTYVGLGGIAVPLAAGFASGLMMGLDSLSSVFLGLLLSATSVSISVQTLREMGKMNSREGTAILGAAVIDDIVVVLILAFVLGFAGGDVSLSTLIVKKAGFFVGALFVGWKAVPWMMDKFTPLRVTEARLSIALVLAFLFAYTAELAGIAAIIGAYIAGVAIARTKHGEAVVHKVEPLAYSIFVPVFFTSIGVMTEVVGLGPSEWLLALALSFAAVFSKWTGAGLGAKWAGFDLRSSAIVGAGMVSRGEVALIIAAIGMESKLLSPSLFAVIVIVVLITTVITPPLLKWTYRARKLNRQ